MAEALPLTVRLLLDTHALIWWLTADRRLTARAARAIDNERNTVVVSAASAFEIAIKTRLGKLEVPPRFAGDLAGVIGDEEFLSLDITIGHAQLAGSLPGDHGDPFDRLLAAQAQLEDLLLLSNDPSLERLGATLYW